LILGGVFEEDKGSEGVSNPVDLSKGRVTTYAMRRATPVAVILALRVETY
jgi:hypothetical protein